MIDDTLIEGQMLRGCRRSPRRRRRASENEAKIAGGHVFGETSIQGGEYRFADGCALLKDVVIPEAKHRKPPLPHELVPETIVLAVSVLGPVDLDDELFLPAAKIGEVRANRVLADEMMAAEFSGSQFEPK